jgi:hypothetical protein
MKSAFLGNFPSNPARRDAMSDASHQEFERLMNEISPPERLGFTLKQAFSHASRLTGINARRLRRIWNKEVKLLGEEMLLLQKTAERESARRAAEKAATIKVGEDHAFSTRTAALLEGIHLAAQRLAEVGAKVGGDEVRREFEQIAQEVAALRKNGGVLGPEGLNK